MTAPAKAAPADPFIEALVDAMMTHAAPDGAVDYPKAAAAFAQLLAEMIGPQDLPIRREMVSQFFKELDRSIQLAALRASVVPGGKVQ